MVVSKGLDLGAVPVETMLNKEGSIQPYDTMSPWINCRLQFIYVHRLRNGFHYTEALIYIYYLLIVV